MGHAGRMDWLARAQWDSFAEEQTTAHRLASGRDGWLDRYGEWVVWSGARPPRAEKVRGELSDRYAFAPRGYLARELVRKASDQTPAELLAGEAPGRMVVHEAGLACEVEPAGGYSSGLFLDQRLNRRWVARCGAERMLNLFAYTGSFTVCAAAAGAATCSVDAAKRALVRTRTNLELNSIDPAEGHRFLIDDAMKVVPRLARRGEMFDLIVLDPPTFGRAEGRVFRIEKDLEPLVRLCWEVLEFGGWLLVSCNYAGWDAAELRQVISGALHGEKFACVAGELPPEIPRGAVSWRIGKVG